MSVKVATIFRNNVSGLAFSPISVNNTTVNGVAISEPWSIGRALSFNVCLGALANAVTIVVQGLLRSDGTTWETVKAHNATDDLDWASASVSGTSDNTFAAGELNLSMFDSTVYKSIRIAVTNGSATACLVSASYMIGNLLSTPNDQAVPDLWMEQRYDGGIA